MAAQSIRDRYFAALKNYITRQEEEQLVAAADLGRELVRANMPTEEIVEIHEEAIQRLARQSSDITLLDTARLTATPLMELLMAYGLAFRARLEIRQRAETEIRRHNRELSLLNRIIAASASGQDTEAILEVACRELARAFDLPQTTAALLNEKKTEAVVVAEYRTEGQPPALNETIPVAGNPAFQYLLIHKAPLVIEDARTDPRLTSPPFPPPVVNGGGQHGAVSLLLLPLIIKDEVAGSLNLSAVEPRPFSTEEINLAWSVAEQVSGALARARLDKDRRRLSTAIEQSSEIIFITDSGGAILYVNPAFEQVSGYSRAEAIGQNPRILKSGKHDLAFYEELWTTITAGKVWHGRLINKKKDGTLYTEETTISPVRDENGTIVNYVAIKRDITRQLELEEQYRQAQKMEAIGLLAGGIAHDFNNLLTAILGFAELARAGMLPHDPHRELLDKVLYSGQRAVGLVRQLLTFSRKQLIEPHTLNLNTVVTEMDKMLRRIIGEIIEPKTILAPDLGPVKVDPAQIEQVIVNLVVNARDAMPNGGKLTIETANVTLDRDSIRQHAEMEPGEYVMLAISDSGMGMAEEVKVHIFEPFFTTKEVGKGTGLGLATCFGIVKQSGGHIWVYSEVGRGTTFKIYLPRAEEAVGSVSRPDQSPDLPRGTETILLVEDEPSVRALAARVLCERGYSVLEAANGQKALRLVEARPELEIDLLLTDVVMPRLGGKALAEQLGATRPDLKVLLISGYTDNTIAHHGVLEAGIAFLQKPFSPATLARKVRQVLDE